MYHIDVFGFSRQNSILESVGEVTISKMTFRFFCARSTNITLAEIMKKCPNFPFLGLV